MLELRAHKEKALAAMATAQQQIVHLTGALAAVRGAASPASQATCNQEVLTPDALIHPLLLPSLDLDVLPPILLLTGMFRRRAIVWRWTR